MNNVYALDSKNIVVVVERGSLLSSNFVLWNFKMGPYLSGCLQVIVGSGLTVRSKRQKVLTTLLQNLATLVTMNQMMSHNMKERFSNWVPYHLLGTRFIERNFHINTSKFDPLIIVVWDNFCQKCCLFKSKLTPKASGNLAKTHAILAPKNDIFGNRFFRPSKKG